MTQFAKAHGYENRRHILRRRRQRRGSIDERKGFAQMLERIAGNGVRTIIVETASRFARDLIVQETGWRFLQGLGVTLVAADSPELVPGHDADGGADPAGAGSREPVREGGAGRQAQVRP